MIYGLIFRFSTAEYNANCKDDATVCHPSLETCKIFENKNSIGLKIHLCVCKAGNILNIETNTCEKCSTNQHDCNQLADQVWYQDNWKIGSVIGTLTLVIIVAVFASNKVQYMGHDKNWRLARRHEV